MNLDHPNFSRNTFRFSSFTISSCLGFENYKKLVLQTLNFVIYDLFPLIVSSSASAVCQNPLQLIFFQVSTDYSLPPFLNNVEYRLSFNSSNVVVYVNVV